jgi:oxygen-dependent protoporphyrinogen oxidase
MIAIIGAGISGLSLAHFLEKEGKEYMLFEKNNRVGGVIKSEVKDGVVYDLGPNSLMVNDDVEELINDLGLENQVKVANEASKKRYLIDEKGIQTLPSSPMGFMKSDLLKLSSKLSIAKELLGWYRKSKGDDDTVETFFSRHFSKEITDKFVYAFVNGIYSSNPSDLDLEITFPKLQEFEKKYKSILKGFIKEKSFGRMKTINFTNGLSTLTNAISDKITNIQLDTGVTKIDKHNNSFVITYQKGAEELKVTVDKVVFSCPARVAGDLMKGLSRKLVQYFEAIDYLSINTVSTLYPKNKTKAPIDGFGVLRTKYSESLISGTIWVSNVFPYKSRESNHLLVSMVKEDLPKDQLLAKVDLELRNTYKIDSDLVASKVMSWKNALPVYNRNLKTLQNKVRPLQTEGIYFHANWMDGISIKECISKSKKISTFL